MTKKDEEKWYLVPDVEIRVHESWIRLIRFCQTSLPNGQICFKINNSQPGKLVWEYTKRDIRFDKEQDIPLNFDETQV